MRQYKQQWSARWNGHTIVVENWFALLLRNGENVFVDGDLICERKRSSGKTPSLEAEIHDESGTHQLRVDFGTSNTFDTVCHIFVNDELVGGDTSEKMLPLELPTSVAPTPQLSVAEQRKHLKRQLFRELIEVAIFIWLCWLLGTNFSPFSEHILFIVLLAWWLLRIVRKIYDLLKIFRQNPTDKPKNSTLV